MVEVLNSATVGFSRFTLTGEFLSCHVSHVRAPTFQPLAPFTQNVAILCECQYNEGYICLFGPHLEQLTTRLYLSYAKEQTQQCKGCVVELFTLDKILAS